MYMEQVPSSPGGSRRDEDIALDLLKFVASVAGVGRATTTSTGFTAPSAPKQDDQITQLLELYTRCLHAVEGKV
jgi:hypothetical protein